MVFFRAETYDSAIRILRSMSDISALMKPRQTLNVLSSQSEALIWIVVLLVVSWTMPNTQQFMRRFMSSEFYRIETPHMLTRLTWQPNLIYAVCLAVISAITIMSLRQPSEFIYFQF